MSEQRDILIDSAGRLFEAHADAPALAQAQGYQTSLWAAVEALGIPQLLIPESHGGMGVDWDDACGVLEASGYWQIPLPLAETMLARRLAALAGVPFPDEPISISPDPVTTLRTTSGWQVTTELRAVPWARHVSTVLVTTREPEGACLVVLSRSDAELRQSENLATEPRDDLQFKLAPAQVMPLPMPDAANLLSYLALLRTAQISGALRSVLHRTVAYANERKQFGKALGQFQCIQQQLAVFGAEVAAVSCAVRSAARATDAGDAHFQIAAAKLRANHAIGVATSTPHQVHGAIGFTQEYSLRHATQRLWSWRSEYGNDRFWSLQLGHSAIASGAEAFWAELTARDDATSLRNAAL